MAVIFRQQVIDHVTRRLDGKVILHAPLSIRAITLLMVGVTMAVLWLASTITMPQTVILDGRLRPVRGGEPPAAIEFFVPAAVAATIPRDARVTFGVRSRPTAPEKVGVGRVRGLGTAGGPSPLDGYPVERGERFVLVLADIDHASRLQLYRDHVGPVTARVTGTVEIARRSLVSWLIDRVGAVRD